MPYIDKDMRRGALLMAASEVPYPKALSTGELNFVITTWVDDFVGEIPTYARINDVVGTLECLIARLTSGALRVHPEDGTLGSSIIELLNKWLESNARFRAVGVLSCVLREFYHRVAVPYEDFKRAVNGDVYRHRHYS